MIKTSSHTTVTRKWQNLWTITKTGNNTICLLGFEENSVVGLKQNDWFRYLLVTNNKITTIYDEESAGASEHKKQLPWRQSRITYMSSHRKKIWGNLNEKFWYVRLYLPTSDYYRFRSCTTSFIMLASFEGCKSYLLQLVQWLDYNAIRKWQQTINQNGTYFGYPAYTVLVKNCYWL